MSAPENQKEAVRTTIVGGRPPGSGRTTGTVPRGVEVLGVSVVGCSEAPKPVTPVGARPDPPMSDSTNRPLPNQPGPPPPATRGIQPDRPATNPPPVTKGIQPDRP